jgi:hypothetical protein
MSDDKEIDSSRPENAIAGYLLRRWIPRGFVRKGIMLCICIGGLYGLFTDHPYAMLLWLLLPLFSPRAVGELAFLIGRFHGGLRR